MNKYFSFIAMLLISIATGWAQGTVANLAVSPAPSGGQFDENTTWYTIKNFKTGGTYSYLSTGSGYVEDGYVFKLTNTTKDATSAGEWCIVAEGDGYKFYNHELGTDYVLSTSNSSKGGMVVASGAAAYTFSIENGTNKAGVSGWFIKDGTSGNNYWNQQKDYLAHWNDTGAKGDNNSTFVFEKVSGPDPKPDPKPETGGYFSASTTDASYWAIKFNGGNAYISDEVSSNDLIMTSAKMTTTWALIGTAENFKLVSNNGHYVGTKENAKATNGQTSTLCCTTTEGNAVTFKLVNDNGTTFEIARTSDVSTTFNPWGGIKTGMSIGFWKAGDNNNKLVFINPEDAGEYMISGKTSFEKPSKHTLWYDEPAPLDYAGWQEYSLPIGNGELGGSIFGGVKNDKITFNEKSLWDGASVTRGNGPHGEYLKFGQVNVKNLSDAFAAGVSDYARYLDIENAVAGVEFTDATGTKYTRTIFSSQPEKVLTAKYTAEGANKMSLKFSVVPGGQMTERSTKKPTVVYNGHSATFNGKLELLSYAYNLTIEANNGATITAENDGIKVENASEIYVYMTGGTDFDAFQQNAGFVNGTASQLPSIMADRISATSAKNWENVKSEHSAEYRSFMDRAAIELKKDGQDVNSDLNTKTLIDSYGANKDGFKDSAEGLFLEQLYYNYGRYLLISSNRYAPVPNNLQGLWVDTDNGHAPWNSDIHTNINIQMNYWPAEQNNLSDLHMPLLDHIVSISNSPGCLNQAKTAGQSVGWVVNTESNLFGGMSSWSSNYTIANAWYVTHLWQHYRFTLDKEYLAYVFPAMWSAAQYWAERMVKANDGTYECPNEFSPEHGPSQNATAHSQQLVNELFANTLAAIEELGNESTLDAKWLSMIRDRAAKSDSGLHLETYVASSKWGEEYIKYGEPLLREWKYSDFTVGQNHHRHTSHLMALYPFDQIQPGDEYFQGAINSLAQRSDNSTGWAMGWRVNLWARALDGNHARRMINNALVHAGGGLNYGGSGCVYYNLWDAHTPFQIDGNFGVCAGISEMVLQSGSGVIRLLPALPDAWSEGSVRGLKAVGNFTVGMTWAKSQLTSATFESVKGQPLTIESAIDLTTVNVTDQNGEPIKVTPTVGKPGCYSILTKVGDVISINYTEPADPSVGIKNTQVNHTFAPVYDLQGKKVDMYHSGIQLSKSSKTLVK